jgi:hypothetical protein
VHVIALHCDGPNCDSWASRGELTRDWIIARWGDESYHFCRWFCVMRHAETKIPMTVVSNTVRTPSTA